MGCAQNSPCCRDPYEFEASLELPVTVQSKIMVWGWEGRDWILRGDKDRQVKGYTPESEEASLSEGHRPLLRRVRGCDR